MVVNNTILTSKNKPFTTFAYPDHAPSQKGSIIVNNLYTGQAEFVIGSNAPEKHHNGNYEIDEQFVPTINSKAIDAGVEIKGVTDGFSGKSPDIGAYEFGGVYWKPGADWKEE